MGGGASKHSSSITGGDADFYLEVKHRKGVEDLESIVRAGVKNDEELLELQKIRTMLHTADQKLYQIGEHYLACQNAKKLELAKQEEKRLEIVKKRGKLQLNTTYERLFTNASGDMKAVFATDPLLMKFAHHAPYFRETISHADSSSPAQIQPKPPPR
jgi:hypothetical protein